MEDTEKIFVLKRGSWKMIFGFQKQSHVKVDDLVNMSVCRGEYFVFYSMKFQKKSAPPYHILEGRDSSQTKEKIPHQYLCEK